MWDSASSLRNEKFKIDFKKQSKEESSIIPLFILFIFKQKFKRFTFLNFKLNATLKQNSNINSEKLYISKSI